MATTRLTGTKWIKLNTIEGGSAAGIGQIAQATVDTWNMVADSVDSTILNDSDSYTVAGLTAKGGDLIVQTGAGVQKFIIDNATGDIATDGSFTGKGNVSILDGTDTPTFTVDAATGDTFVGGNLQVVGDVDTVATTTLSVTDATVIVAKNDGTVDITGTNDGTAGLVVDNGLGTNASLIFKDSSATKFAAGVQGSEIDLVGVSGVATLTDKTYTLTGANIQGSTDIESALRALDGLVGGTKGIIETDATDTAYNDVAKTFTIVGVVTVNSVYCSGLRMMSGLLNDYTVTDDGSNTTITLADNLLGNLIVEYVS